MKRIVLLLVLIANVFVVSSLAQQKALGSPATRYPKQVKVGQTVTLHIRLSPTPETEGRLVVTLKPINPVDKPEEMIVAGQAMVSAGQTEASVPVRFHPLVQLGTWKIASVEFAPKDLKLRKLELRSTPTFVVTEPDIRLPKIADIELE